jgi:peptidoglycan hydrolase-like protein with peptidoglycan-binding domain
LNLLPVFPGELTFEPTGAIGQDKSIVGNLYLEMSPAAALDFGRYLPDLKYRFLMIYRNVLLSGAFLAGTVANAKFANIRPGTPTATVEQKNDAFRRGFASVIIEPSKADPNCVMPIVQKDATQKHVVMLELGVRMAPDPFVSPENLTLLNALHDDIVHPSRFLPVPMAYFYNAVRSLPLNDWTDIAASGHDVHPFYASLDLLEQGAPPERWRRLRVFTSTSLAQGPGSFSAALEDVTVSATAGVDVLWKTSANPLGELFVRRHDLDTFMLEVLQAPPPTYPPPALVPKPVKCLVAPAGSGTAAETQSLILTWDPPSAPGQRAPHIDVRAVIALDGDPLADPLTALEAGVEDFRGITVSGRAVVKGPGRVVARRQLVRPLQVRLATLGFGGRRKRTAGYDVAVRHAVREFQREATVTEIHGQPSRISTGAPVDPTTITPFTGAISGRADEDTLREMRHWFDKSYTAALRFNIRKGATVIKDVGYADADSLGWTVEVPSLVGPSAPFAHSTRFEGRYYGVDTTFGGPGLHTAHLAALARGRKPVDELSDPARSQEYTFLETWHKRVILAVVNNESKIFEAVNTYDNAFMTTGAIQWTIGTGSNAGELPGIIHTLPVGEINRLLGVGGLETTDFQGTKFKTVVTGRFKLDGKRLVRPEQKDELRAIRWAYRFWDASTDDSYRSHQIRHAHARIVDMLDTPLLWGTRKFSAESLLQSEMLRALALDEHVNAGQGALVSMLRRLANALQTPQQLITINSDGTFGGKWFEEQRKPLVTKAQQTKARATKVPVDKVKLTPTEIGAIDFSLLPLIDELLLLRYQCEDPANTPADLVEVIDALGLTAMAAMVTQANTPGLTVIAGQLSDMDMEQHSTAMVLYLWLRTHVSGMHDPNGRWDAIVKGGYAGGFGDPSTTPGVFTP